MSFNLKDELKDELRCLKIRLEETARQTQRDHYHHAILHVDGELTEDIRNITPRIYASGHRVARKQTVHLPQGGNQIHFFFDDNLDDSDHGILALFRQVVSRTQKIMAALPKRLAPAIQVPPQKEKNGLVENELSWLYLLHWLGHQPSNSVFRTHIEFMYSSSDYWHDSQFLPWDQCSTITDFEPIALLTLSGKPGQGCDYWKGRHQEEGKQLPEIIASSLSKPLLYASINAVDLLLRQDDSPSGTRSHVSTVKTKEWEVDLDVSSLLGILMAHHGAYSGVRCNTPMKGTKILEMLKGTESKKEKERTKGKKAGWNQPRISRTMKKIFGEAAERHHTTPVKYYRGLCDDKYGNIARELAAIWEREIEPRTPHETQSDQLDKNSKRKRFKEEDDF